MTYEEYCAFQKNRKVKPEQPQIVVTQDAKGNVVKRIDYVEEWRSLQPKPVLTPDEQRRIRNKRKAEARKNR